MPINLAALSATSGLSSGGGVGMAASPSASTEGRLDAGFDDGLVAADGFLVDLLRGGGAPNTKLDKVVARCCFEERASRSRRFSLSDDDLSISASDSLGRDFVDFDRTAAEGDRSRAASFSFLLALLSSFSFLALLSSMISLGSLGSLGSLSSFSSFGGSASSGALFSFLLDFFGGGAAPQKPQPELVPVRSTRGRSFFDDLAGSVSTGSGAGVGGAPPSASPASSGFGTGGGVGSLAGAAAALSA
ncbi:uncharacterized protein N7498_004184 [Penicillium cinerascens]|uniref:Uncharacterized protein n=1 Tax=Penicillium cinerascens TaxID=70096 RepID=A0A9W9T7K8_9EURO|nr:uncharacterized protein N7498_004184 [Penicillium cinerascens]KAJ5212538.1 hypothetical protein N7498_004184 [Penicillium cinerascens]